MKQALYTVVDKKDFKHGFFNSDCHQFCAETQTEAMAKFLEKYPLKSTNFFVQYEIINLFDYNAS